MRPLLIIALVVFPACERSQVVAGDGVATERAFSLAEVNAVRVAGPMSVQVLVGPGFSPTLRLEGDANVVAALGRTVQARALVLDAKALAPSLPLNVTVTLPSLTALHAADRAVVTANTMHGGRLELSAEASARVLVNGVDADSLVVSVARTSTVDAAGRARVVKVSASDVGTAALGSLRAQVALVEATELSTVRVYALEAVRGEASRASRVEVVGAPALRSLSADGDSSVRPGAGLLPTAEVEGRAPGEG